MDYLSQLNDLLPTSNRLFSNSPGFLGQIAFRLKDAVTILCAAVSIPTAGFGAQNKEAPSEVPFYGRSPPVYPARESTRNRCLPTPELDPADQ
jgi:hypothetical protein